MEWFYLIPIVAILAGSFSEYLKFRQKQEKLGTNTSALEGEVEKLKSERDRMVQRLENLEAIVTSEAWDSIASRSPAASLPPPPIVLEEPSDEDRVAGMARRVRT